MFEIVEKYITLSGEAPDAGEPVFLIRFSRCNLICDYCDTDYHNEVSRMYSEDELAAEIEQALEEYPALKVLFTGGEPLLGNRQAALYELMKRLSQVTFHIETNGSQRIEHFDLSNCTYVVDWKTPSSGQGESFHPENLKRLRAGRDCIKIVTAQSDLEWVKERVELIAKSNPGLAVYLSPQWERIGFEELARFIIDNRLPAALSLQIHKLIWGSEERGV